MPHACHVSSFGREAVSLLEIGDLGSLADRVGYALAFGKNHRVAIEADFQSCLTEFPAAPEPRPRVAPSVAVKYFKPNSGPVARTGTELAGILSKRTRMPREEADAFAKDIEEGRRLCNKPETVEEDGAKP